MPLKHLSLFSGIGGLDLAAEWAGMQTVAFCERDKFCQKVLAKHWPTVPIFGDIHELTADTLRERGIERIDIISGGFPCQPYSDSGKRLGNEDDRALWPEMLRIAAECQPTWIIGENVIGLIRLGALDGICASLESEGFEVWPVVLPACAVNARHIRNRVFILAHAKRSDGGGEKSGTGSAKHAAMAIRGERRKSGHVVQAQLRDFMKLFPMPNEMTQDQFVEALMGFPPGWVTSV